MLCAARFSYMGFHALWAFKRDFYEVSYGVIMLFGPYGIPLCFFCCLLHNFLWDFMLFVPMRFPYEILCVLHCNFRMRFSFEILYFLLHNFFVRLLCWFHAFFWEVAWFCVCKLGGSLAGEECKLDGGGRWKCECVGRQKGLCGSCLIRVTSMHYMKSIRMFEDDITWPEHALVMQGGSLGGLVSGVLYVNWRMFAFFGLSQYLDQGSYFRLLSLRVDCDCNRPSVLATVFVGASKFSTSMICGYSWHRSTLSNKPSPLSTNLCACPAGTYCPSGTLAASTPLTCTVGSYCAKGSTATVLCPTGHYCPSPSSRVPCPAGVVQWDPG
jgi:hypothetical protein